MQGMLDETVKVYDDDVDDNKNAQKTFCRQADQICQCNSKNLYLDEK